MHATEKCRRIPGTGVPTTVTRVTVENILTPSGNPIAGAPDHEINISADLWSLHISSHDEKINGDLLIDAISQDGQTNDKIYFAWDWTNPETNRSETVIWNEGDNGEKTRYGCTFEQPWPKGEMNCGNTENPVDERVSFSRSELISDDPV